ncbi:DUF3667 domain-containing protein [Winogradskyella sp. R77965]|uniref:DUF3667 domain-containing protein n=1 Tax=Winogradskyella sp. R77965 TaxID=3093872 RepID=UPI0037DC70BF
MECKNCNKKLIDTQKFCDECGAKVIQNRLTPKVLAAQVNEQFISIDNKFLRTFIDLFKKPEAVIDGYIHGTRKKYIDVLQYFAISLTLAGIQVFLMTTFFKESLVFGDGFNEGFNASQTNVDNLLPNFDFNNFLNYQGLIYIITVPFYAFGTWSIYYLFKQRIYNFTEHLVLNLYYSAQFIIVTSVFSILFLFFGWDYVIVSALLSIPYFAYLFFILKRIFKNNFWKTLLRFLLVLTVIMISTTVFFTILMIVMIIAFNK